MAHAPINCALGRLIPQVNLVLIREVAHHEVYNLEQLEWRLLVKGSQRELQVEGRVIEALDDHVDL